MHSFNENLHKELREAVKHVIASSAFSKGDEKTREEALIKSVDHVIEKAVHYCLTDFKAHEDELKKNIKRELVAGFLISPDSLAEDIVKIVQHQLEYRAKKQGWVK